MRLLRLFDSHPGRHHEKARVLVRSITLVPETVLQGSTPLMAADMSMHTMLDDVNLTVESAHVNGSVFAIAGYVNGRYANWPAVVSKYGRSGMFLLSIDVQGNPSVGAQCLDIEKGDASIAQGPAWFKATQAAGKAAGDLRWFPKLYIQESNAEALVSEMASHGVKREDWMLWTAHYTGKAHICGPKSCGCPVQADATQWTSSFEGASLDASLCYGYFFSGPPGATPVPVTLVKVPLLVGLNTVTAVAALTHVGLKAGPQASVDGTVNSQTPGPGAEVPKGSTVDIGVKATEKPVDPPKTVAVPDVRGKATRDAVGVLSASGLKAGGHSDVTGTVNGQTPGPGVVVAVGTIVDLSVAVPVPAPVVVVPEPSPEPAPAPAGKAPVLVYVREELAADIAAKLGLPVGTILFIPHTVAGA